MNEDYVSYELAVKLKAAGFDEPCRHYYDIEDAPDGCYWEGSSLHKKNHNEDIPKFSAPTLWQAQKWLREKHHISVRVSYLSYHKVWFADWLNLDSGEFDDTDATFDSYEEALADGITAALELIKKGE